MADSSVKVTNFPTDDSKYRVAYDLMKQILSYEHNDPKKVNSGNAREYFMTLYNQCIRVVYHGDTYQEATKTKSADSSGSVGGVFLS
ncbi:MAG TPA: hypothetical protein VF644_20710 [Pyrinomonadaceae bacterium]|jgi:hypothetical protein